MLNNLRGTSGLKLYRELYHTCAYILVYVDTSLLLGPPVHSRLLAGRNWPILAIHTAIHVHPDRTYVRASSVRELLLVEFLGHARQIPVGYIFYVFPG